MAISFMEFQEAFMESQVALMGYEEAFMGYHDQQKQKTKMIAAPGRGRHSWRGPPVTLQKAY